MGAFTKLFQRLRLTADANVTTQTTTVIQTDTTNSSIALVPNGTGAIIASVPDGTATGGNARGPGAVDLQLNRSAADQVASGSYNVIMGYRNRGGGTFSIAMGESCVSNDTATVAMGSGTTAGAQYAVAFGRSNITNGQQSTISGGQNNQIIGSPYSTISGGQSNTASTNTHATVVGGQSNTSSGQHSVSGGFTNTSSGQYSVTLGNNNIASGNSCVSLGDTNTSRFATSVSIGSGNTGSNNRTYAFGLNNTISADSGFGIGQGNNVSKGSSVAIGESNIINGNSRSYSLGFQNTISSPNGFAIGIGYNTKANSSYSTTLGLWSVTELYGQIANASGLFLYAGDAQQSLLTSRREATLTTSATTVLSLDGTGTTNLIIPSGNNRAWNVQIDTIAVVTAITGTATGVSVGDCYMEKACLLFKRVGGTSSIVGSPDVTSIKSDASMATAGIDINAGSSQQLEIVFNAPSFSGGGSVTFRIVSKVSLVEVAY